MELTTGRKESEVGTIPQEWDVQRLDRCVRPDAPICYGILMPGPHCNDGVPVVKVRDISDGRIEEASLLLAHPSIDAAYERSRLQPDDVLLTIRGTTGRVALVPRELGGANITQDTARVRVRKELSARFIYFALQSNCCRQQVALHTIGQAVKGINIRDVKGLLIGVPGSLSEQDAISEALGDVDTLLAGQDRLIAKKRDLKQAAMQQLLTGRSRLPGFRAEWEARRVDEIGDVLAGKALAARAPGPLRPYLRTKNVLDGRIDVEDVLEMPMTDSEFERFQVLEGDVLLNEGQSLELVGRCSMYRNEFHAPCAMQNQLLRFRAKEGTSAAFAEHLFRRCQRAGTFAAIATQTTSVAHLGSGRFNSLRLLWPTDPLEQRAIAEVLSDIDAELAALESRRDKTRALKQAMMQELLTGRTRLV